MHCSLSGVFAGTDRDLWIYCFSAKRPADCVAFGAMFGMVCDPHCCVACRFCDILFLERSFMFLPMMICAKTNELPFATNYRHEYSVERFVFSTLQTHSTGRATAETVSHRPLRPSRRRQHTTAPSSMNWPCNELSSSASALVL